MKRKDQAFVQTFLRTAAVAAAGGLFVLAGCGPTGGARRTAQQPSQQSPSQQPPSQQSPQADPPLPTGQDVLEQAEAARKSALEFELLGGQLQEAPLSRQRPVMRQVFAKLGEALSNLAGPRRTGVFLHQYAVVLQVRDQLNNRPERLSDVGLIDDGLGAAYNALRDLSYAEFYADEELTKRLDALGKAVARLRSVQGPEHGLQVTDAVTRTGGVLTKMAGTFHERVKAGASEAATVPAAPSTAPPDATAPAATQPTAPTDPAVPTDPAAPATPPATPPAPTAPAPEGTTPAAPATAPEGTPAVPPASAPADPATPAPAPGGEANK